MKKDQIRKHYEPRIDKKSESYHILDWGSAESQTIRFQILLNHLQQNQATKQSQNTTLLDVGCGLTDLCTFLEQHKHPINYTGVDICFDLICEAHRRHPTRPLLYADIFADNPFNPNSFDITYCSGIFNLNLGNNLQFLSKAIPTLLQLSSKNVIINLLHQRVDYHYKHCFYYQPNQILKLIPKQHKVEIIDDYLENDFTIIIHK